MTITVAAIYENGLLKPEKPLPFQDHEKVQITIESARPPIWERIAALAADAPAEEIAKLPPDGAAKIDEHLYGSPRGSE